MKSPDVATFECLYSITKKELANVSKISEILYDADAEDLYIESITHLAFTLPYEDKEYIVPDDVVCEYRDKDAVELKTVG